MNIFKIFRKKNTRVYPSAASNPKRRKDTYSPFPSWAVMPTQPLQDAASVENQHTDVIVKPK